MARKINPGGIFPDTLFTVYDDGNPANKVRLQIAGVSGTVVLTVPNASGTVALTALSLQVANNLSDVANVATARTNLGLVAGGTGDIWVERAGDMMTGSLTISNANPTMQWHESDAAIDEKYWRIIANGAAIYLQTFNDAQTFTSTAISFSRTGNVAGAPTVPGLGGTGNRVVQANASGALTATNTISTFGASLLDDANAAAAIATLGLDADIATLVLPASTTISTFGATLVDDASASAARTTLGVQVGRVEFVAATTAVTWTNMPAALTAFLGSNPPTARQIDLSTATDFRLTGILGVSGTAGSKIRAQYFNGSSYVDLASTATAGDIDIGSTIVPVGSWVGIASGAKAATTTVVLFGVGGNAVDDPTFFSLLMEIR